MKVFSFVKLKDLDRITECGMKTSEYGTFEIKSAGIMRQCIIAFMTPFDSPFYGNEEFIPIKIDVNTERTLIGEGMYRKVGMEDEFQSSFVKISDYKLGTFRNPECILTETVFPEFIEEFNDKMDEPLLYKSSEELYVNSLFEELADCKANFREMALRAFFDSGKYDSSENGNCKFYSMNGKITFISKMERES